ncbi:MAG: T9SS type A sorting domain-containing protein, partial [Taibaiella sp.]|nr:T9SS type A sorting domain-containing protein [Taibaiella sp.]
LLYIVCCSLPTVAQYAPQAGVAGSTAISKNDNRIVAWATTCAVERGWLDIADKQQGRASLGEDGNATGKADNYIVSLGDSGTAVLTFPAPLYNGPGTDFAIFENGFPNPDNPEEAFLEFAFVEVSSDGLNYTRFSAASLTDTPQVPVAGVFMNARKVHNLAGKYIMNYGTPFDLDELKNVPGLDVNNITHIRLVDVIGSLTHGTTDKDGNPINDPYPSAIPSCGFDLDGVAAMHMKGWWPSGVDNIAEDNSVHLYPNPAHDRIQVPVQGITVDRLTIKDVTGRVMMNSDAGVNTGIDISHLPAGVYYLILNDRNGKEWIERFSKY